MLVAVPPKMRSRLPGSASCLCVVLAGALAIASPSHAQATNPPQIPLCMVGDSITWAEDADDWRKDLLEQIPTLAFVGTHSAKLGYSHAGEGQDTTMDVLARMDEIPASPYYHLLIGTNDAAAPHGQAAQDAAAAAIEGRIEKIVAGLLDKPGAKKVFVGSVVPSRTLDPSRDEVAKKVNGILRRRVVKNFPPGSVVWVEYEYPVRAIRNWGPIIRLHPTSVGYELLSIILAQTLRDELRLGSDVATPVPAPGAGVRVTNLWGDGGTSAPVVPGWYTMSFDVVSAEPGATVTLTSDGTARLLAAPAQHRIAIPEGSVGKRYKWNLMTGYRGIDYAPGRLLLATSGCRIGRVLFEKKRPNGRASVYGTGTYLDTVDAASPGELVEMPERKAPRSGPS